MRALPEPNLDLIIALINEVKKGLVVVLNDGDDNITINNKTTEILLLLAELRDLLKEMKYCDNAELSEEIQKLVAEVTEELHKRRDVDIKKNYPELEGFLSDGVAFNPDTMHNDFATHPDKMLDISDVAVVEKDWYDDTIHKLYEAIEMAYQALNECSCEDINTPSSSSVVHNHYEGDSNWDAKLNELKLYLQNLKVECKGEKGDPGEKGDTGELPEIDCELLKQCCDPDPDPEDPLYIELSSLRIAAPIEGNTPEHIHWSFVWHLTYQIEKLFKAAFHPCMTPYVNDGTGSHVPFDTILWKITHDVLNNAPTIWHNPPGIGVVGAYQLDPVWMQQNFYTNLHNALMTQFGVSTLEECFTEDFIKRYYPNWPDCDY